MSSYPFGDHAPAYCDGCRWPLADCVCDLLETCRHCDGAGGGVSPDEPWGYAGATPGGWDDCPVCDGEGVILVLPPKHGPVDYPHLRGLDGLEEIREALADVLAETPF